MKTFKSLINQFHHAVRRLLCVFTLASFSMALNAQEVDEATAMQRAQAFLNKRGLATKTIHKSSRTGNTRSGEVNAPLYFFNIGNEEGFVVVSGDNRTREILGYTYSGSYDESKLPENAKSFFKSLEEQIKSIPAEYKKSPTTRASVEKNAISPLIKTKWSQERPYNAQCPIIWEEQSLTGCVATAMAQVLNYWQFPEKLPSVPGYRIEGSGTDVDMLPSKEIDYSGLKRTYTGVEMEDENLSWLMRYCGQSVKMEYSTSGSGAFPEDIPNAMISFGYNSRTQLAKQQHYSIDGWNKLIYNELSHKRPVIYNGWTSSGSGHTFICDGYGSEEMFHINWGWNGYADGYFVLTLFQENINDYAFAGDGYNNGSLAVIGITPNSLESGFNPQGDRIGEAQSTDGLQIEVEMIGGHYAKHPAQIRATVTNNGEDYTGIWGFMVKGDNISYSLNTQDVRLKSGEKATYLASFDGYMMMEEGDWTFSIFDNVSKKELWVEKRTLPSLDAWNYYIALDNVEVYYKGDDVFVNMSVSNGGGDPDRWYQGTSMDVYPYPIYTILKFPTDVVPAYNYLFETTSMGTIGQYRKQSAEILVGTIPENTTFTLGIGSDRYTGGTNGYFYWNWVSNPISISPVNISPSFYHWTAPSETNGFSAFLADNITFDKESEVIAFTATVNNGKLQLSLVRNELRNQGVILKGIPGKKYILPYNIGYGPEEVTYNNDLLCAQLETEVEPHSVMILSEREGSVGFVSYEGSLLGKGTVYLPKSKVPNATVGCADDFIPIAIESIAENFELSKKEITIQTGHTFKLRGKSTPEDIWNKKITWSTDNSEVADISNDGRITAKKPGTAVIIASTNDGSGKSATCKVTVADEIKYVPFEDEVFEGLILSEFDKDNDGKISLEETETLWSVRYSNCGITSVAGIEYFSNMNSLYLTYNNIEEINLNTNKELVSLNLNYNKLSSLDISHCSKLFDVECSYNKIVDFSLGKHDNLGLLKCKDNNIISLDLTGCPSVEYVECDSNQISELDWSKCVKLKYIHCTNNKIQKIKGLQNHLSVEGVSCGGNKLTEVIVENCPNLTGVGFESNNLRSLSIINCEKLDGIGCAVNELSSIKISGCPMVSHLSCGTNNFSTFDLDLPNLKYLSIENNKLQSLDLRGFSNLEWLICEYNNMSSLNIDGCTALQTLYSKANKLTSVDVSTNINLHCWVTATNKISSFDLTNNHKLSKLDCSFNPISSIDLSKCYCLNSVYCDNTENIIKILDLSHNAQIKAIGCSGVESIALSKGHDISRISFNNILDIKYIESDKVLGIGLDQDLCHYMGDNITWGENDRLDKLACGKTKQYSVTVLPVTAVDKSVTWTSSDNNIATVSENGLVTAMKQGIATITITANDGSGVFNSFEIEVVSSEPVYSSLFGFNPSLITIKVGEQGTKSLWFYSDLDISTINHFTQVSSDPTIVSDDIIGLSEGEAEIYLYAWEDAEETKLIGVALLKVEVIESNESRGYDGNKTAIFTNDLEEFFNNAFSENAIMVLYEKTDDTRANIIYKEENGYNAYKIRLTDQQPFYCPVDVHTDKISYTRNFTNTNWQPLYLPFEISIEDLTKAGLEVAKLNSAQMKDVDADGVADKIQIDFLRMKSGCTVPNKPYLVRAKTTGEHVVEISNATIYRTIVESVDCSTTESNFTFTGTYETIFAPTIQDNNYYVMSKGALCKVEEYGNLYAFRWYMSMTPRNQYTISDASLNTSVSIDGENISTDISNDYILDESSVSVFSVGSVQELYSLSYTRDFTNTSWQPMYVPFKISAEELEAAGLEVAKLSSAQMIDEDADGNAEKMQINFLRVKSGSTLPNKPYLVRAKTTGEHTVEISDATIYKTTVESVDCSTTEMEFTFTGTYEGVSGATILENNYYVMSKGALCTAEDSSSDLKAFRWYMSLTPRYQYGTQVPRTRALISIDGENATTDIEDIFDKEDSRPDTVHISSQIIGLKPGEYRLNGKKMVVE